MKRTSLIAVIHAACVAISNADIIYNIDFEPPSYTNGQNIAGAGIISDGVPGFTSHALLLVDGGGLPYFAPTPFTSGLHSISWEFAVPVAQTSTEIIGMLLGSAHIDISMSGFAGSSTYLIEYGPFLLGEPRQSVPFQIGEAYSFTLLLDIDAARYDFFLNGNQLLNDEPLQFGANSFDYVRFGQNQTLGLQAGVDNFRWEVIPEPSSLLLILLGGGALALARRSAHIKNRALNNRLHTYG